jgi:hypothetical protein
MRALVCLATLIVLTAGCDNGSTSAVAATPTVAAPTVTEVFPSATALGTLAVGATDAYFFNVCVAPGTVNATLTAAGPPATIQVGFALGTPNGPTTCTPILTITTAAGSSPQLTGTASATGQYCVTISDVGNLAAPVTYQIVVAHP